MPENHHASFLIALLDFGESPEGVLVVREARWQRLVGALAGFAFGIPFSWLAVYLRRGPRWLEEYRLSELDDFTVVWGTLVTRQRSSGRRLQIIKNGNLRSGQALCSVFRQYRFIIALLTAFIGTFSITHVHGWKNDGGRKMGGWPSLFFDTRFSSVQCECFRPKQLAMFLRG